MPLAFTLLAIVSSLLSAGGIVSQIIAWRREGERLRLEKEAESEKAKVEAAKVKVEAAKVEAGDAKDERDHTGRFQQRLIDRVEALERKHDTNLKKIEALEVENTRCKASNLELRESNRELREQHQELQRRHELLTEDHATLKHHVEMLERRNLELRQKIPLNLDAGVISARDVAKGRRDR